MDTWPAAVQFQWTLRLNVGWQWNDMKPSGAVAAVEAGEPVEMSDTITSTSGRKLLLLSDGGLIVVECAVDDVSGRIRNPMQLIITVTACAAIS